MYRERNEIVVSNNNVYEYAAGESFCLLTRWLQVFFHVGAFRRSRPQNSRESGLPPSPSEELEHCEVHDDSNYAPPHKTQICAEPPETGLHMPRVQLLSCHKAGGWFLLRVLGFRCYFFLASPSGQPSGACREVTRVLESKDVILLVAAFMPIIYQECITSLQPKEKKSIWQLRN